MGKPNVALSVLLSVSIFAISVNLASGAAQSRSNQVPGRAIVDQYQKTVAGFLLQQPTDGRFGTARTPSIHGLYATNIEGYRAIKELSKSYRIYSILAGSPGKLPQRLIHSVPVSSFPEILQTKQFEARCFMRIYDEIDWYDPAQGALAFGRSFSQNENKVKKQRLLNISKDIVLKLQGSYNLIKDKSTETNASKTILGGEPAWMISRSIKPTDNSCYNCHTGVKPGQPIGQIITFLIQKSKS